MSYHVSVFPSILRLNNVPLYMYTTFSLSIHLWMDTWVASIFYITFVIVNDAALNMSIRLYSFIAFCAFPSDLVCLFIYSLILH